MKKISIDDIYKDFKLMTINSKDIDELEKHNQMLINFNRELVSLNEDVFYNLDTMINETIKDIGLDNYLYEQNSFFSNKYKETVKKFNELYLSNKIDLSKYVKQAFDYAISLLKSRKFIYFDTNENDYKLIVTSNSDNALNVLYELYKNDNEENKYMYIKEFMEYVSEKEISKQKTL